MGLDITEFYLSEQKFIDLIEITRNHKSLDDSQKIYYFTYLFLKAEVNELNFLQARDKIVQNLDNYNINFEDKFFFSNGYKILKIYNFEENTNYLTFNTFLPERWNYWLNRWEEYHKELFYQNIISIFSEILNSISQFIFKTNRKLIDIDIKLLTAKLKEIIGFTDLLKTDKMEVLKTAIKYLNCIRNNLKKNQYSLQKLISYLIVFFKKEFSLEKTIDLLFKELEKKAGRGLKLLNLLSDIIYLTNNTRNPDITPSLIKILSDGDIDLKNIEELKKFLREKLMKIAKPDLEEYTIFFAIRNIQIISKIPSFPNIHFFHREIDESYKEKLGKEFPNIDHWVRVIVEAKGIKDAIFRSEKILKKYQNFGILKDLHFKLIRKNYLVFKNNKKYKERFKNYNNADLLDFLPKLVMSGWRIQISVIEVICKESPKYFFENKLEFGINTWAFKKLLDIISRNKFVELKEFLMKHAEMCITNWMHDSRTAFHNKFLFTDILETILNIGFHEDAFELLDKFINQIEDWKNINNNIFKPINQLKTSKKIYFIKKIYEQYAKFKEEDNHNASFFIRSCILPYHSEDYIEFCMEILKKTIFTDYILANGIISNLIFLKPDSIEKIINELIEFDIHKKSLPMVLRLVAIGKPDKSLQFLNNYLSNDDDKIKNVAFNEIHRIYENKNILWYNNVEKS